jgi:molybdenum cofactor cytidylyltransferase
VIACVLLAAGASRRMGSPKALLEFRGETFLNRLIRIMGAVCDPVIVVLGHHAESIRAGVRGNATVVVNREPERGQLSSLQTGLAVVPADAEGFAFMPMDCPAVRESTVAALAETFSKRDAGTLLVIPRIGDKRGHPVFGARSIALELMALPLSAGAARDVVHAHVDRTQYVDVDDAGILTDVDDPEAYRRLLGCISRWTFCGLACSGRWSGGWAARWRRGRCT